MRDRAAIVTLLVWSSVSILLYLVLFQPLVKRQENRILLMTQHQSNIEILQDRLLQLHYDSDVVDIPKSIVWRNSTKNEAALSLQKSVVGLARENGVELISFGASPVKSGKSKDTIGFEVEAESTLSEFYYFLAALEQLEPGVAVAEIRLRPAQLRPGTESHVFVITQLKIWSFWEMSR